MTEAPRRMTPRQDPYRVLGLVAGATAGEIRSAYRRLAKLNHPDTAGERSLPRFLAIRSAYEELVDAEGRLRAHDWPGWSGGAARRPAGAAANRASREAWRARRAGGSAGGRGPAGGAAGSSGAGAGGSGSAGASGPGNGQAGAGGRPSGPRSRAGSNTKSSGAGARPDDGAHAGPSSRAGSRPKAADRRTARPGSTTYDEAAQPLDPSWEGGSWYGASSGSYWTLNPREYADPRKHGPEYQERAKRAAQLEAARRAGVLPPEDATPTTGRPSSASSASSASSPSSASPASSPSSASSATSASSPSSASSGATSPGANPGLPLAHRRSVRRPAGPGAA